MMKSTSCEDAFHMYTQYLYHQKSTRIHVSDSRKVPPYYPIYFSDYARSLISCWIFAKNSSQGIAPCSPTPRLRTATFPSSTSLSPTTSM